jgi:pimeloyl-ACP methyl ester carboxylesterase
MPVKTENSPLVIMLHGYSTKTNKYESLRYTLMDIYQCKEVLMPPLKLSMFSWAKPNQIVLEILSIIDTAWNNIREQENRTPAIILVGHSIGALLARKVYITACGENQMAPFEKELTGCNKLAWAEHVEKIILLAGINRGWTINPRISVPRAFLIGLLTQIGKLFKAFGYPPIIFEIKRGATFITQLRIQSLAMQQHAAIKGVGNAITIQLLGTKDDLVSPDDNVDLVTGNHFIYLDMPLSNHVNVINMTGTKGVKRAAFLKEILLMPETDLRKIAVLTSDEIFPLQDNNVTDVVFVIHGIRDTGFWTHKIARKVKLLGDSLGKKFATETSTYGYFAMLSFLLYGSRRAKVEWLMDKYTENMAIYPKAAFSFVGHSNGTYLLAKALKEYPACHFKNVLLAGSVVRNDYDWKQITVEGRVKNIYNIVATNDWVVGIFPKTFQTLKLQDLGSGGFDGFSYLEESAQFKCIKGTHGAGVEEEVWDEIAYFIVYGQPKLASSLQKKERPFYIKVLCFLGPVLFIAGMLIIILTGIFIYLKIADPAWRIVAMSCYLYLVWKCLTWF